MINKKITFCFTLILLFCAVSIGYLHFGKKAQPRMMRQAQVETQPIMTRTLADHVSGYGTIQSQKYTTIKSLHSNKITHIEFNGGETVHAGQTLLKLDTRTARAQLAQDQAQLTQAKHNWQRQANLLHKRLISQSEYDDSYSSYQQAKAVIAEDKTLLSELTIQAPFTGIISITDFHVGDVLDVNSNIATLYDPNQLIVTYQLLASKDSAYRIGQTITIQSELDASNKVSGKVTYVSPSVSNGLVTLRADISKGSNFKPGQNVKVLQQTKQLQNQVTIPTSSLMTNLEGTQAFIVKNGKAVLRDVKVGNYYDGYVQVLSGLTAGEELVTNGQHYLHPNELVVVNNNTSQAEPENRHLAMSNKHKNIKLAVKNTTKNSEVKK